MSEANNPFRVLVVEDEVLVSDLIADVLVEHGFEVHAVSKAEDALQHLTGGAPCDVLFTDINLAGQLDGTALARVARKVRPDLAVVYTSGTVIGVDPAAAVPGSSFVPKPYDPEKVCVLLQRCIATAH